MTEAVGVERREEGRLLDNWMELKDRARRLQMAVAHDGALLIDHRFIAPVFTFKAIVDCA